MSGIPVLAAVCGAGWPPIGGAATADDVSGGCCFSALAARAFPISLPPGPFVGRLSSLNNQPVNLVWRELLEDDRPPPNVLHVLRDWVVDAHRHIDHLAGPMPFLVLRHSEYPPPAYSAAPLPI